jgi:hypothetical protein
MQWKMWVCFMTIWSILRPIGIFMAILYIFWSFGTFSLFWFAVGTKKNLATLQCSDIETKSSGL